MSKDKIFEMAVHGAIGSGVSEIGESESMYLIMNWYGIICKTAKKLGLLDEKDLADRYHEDFFELIWP